MIIYAWNSQGAKWNNFPHFDMGRGQPVALVISEAGWAPWVSPTKQTEQKNGSIVAVVKFNYNTGKYDPVPADIVQNHQYDFRTMENFLRNGRFGNNNQTRDLLDFFTEWHSHNTGRWFPWVRDLTSLTNARCSAALIANRQSSTRHNQWVKKQGDVLIGGQTVTVEYRGVLTHTFKVGTHDGERLVRICALHLKSSSGAQEQFDQLLGHMKATNGGNMVSVVVGDLNININNMAALSQAESTIQRRLGGRRGSTWMLLNSEEATHKSGGELDWAIVYDPSDLVTNCDGRKCVGYEGEATPAGFSVGDWTWNESDHAVMEYTLNLRNQT